MKTLLLALCLFSWSASGQNLIGLKKLDVVEYFQTNRPEATPEFKVATNGHDYIVVEKGDIREDVYYFNDNGVCYAYMALYTSYKYLNAVVEALNDNFTIYPDKWIDYDENMDYLWTIDRNEGFFAVKCEIYKIH